MAERITVVTGKKTYEIADTEGNVLGTFSFVPTDVSILERYKSVAEYFRKVSEEIKERDVEETIAELEKGIREKIDYMFDAPVSESFFSITSPLTLLEDGGTFAEHIVGVVGQVIENEMKDHKLKHEKRVEKYTAKYKQK